MQIHIGRDGQRLGPYSLEEVRTQLAAGTLGDSDLAWYEGAANWMPLSTVPSLAGPGGPAIPSVTSASAAAIPTATAVNPSTSSNYAGFWIRVAAYIIDVIILFVPVSIIQSLFKGTPDDPATGHVVIGIFLIILFEVAYFAGLWSSAMQATVGQKVFGLRVVSSVDGSRISIGRGILRMVGLFVAALILCIGLIMVAFTQRKQGLHDLIASTYVIKTR